MDLWRGVGVRRGLLAAALLVTAGLLWASGRVEPHPGRGAGGAGLAAQPASPAGTAQEQVPEKHRFEIAARRYTFTPARIEVRENDLVTIVFSTEDIPHSFTIDEYRIAKRAAPGRPATFQFRAEKAGTFVFYCNLTTEEGCKKMRGELVVRPK